jgi:hypothetical protein
MSSKPPLNASAKAHTHREIMVILGGLMTFTSGLGAVIGARDSIG